MQIRSQWIHDEYNRLIRFLLALLAVLTFALLFYKFCFLFSNDQQMSMTLALYLFLAVLAIHLFLFETRITRISVFLIRMAAILQSHVNIVIAVFCLFIFLGLALIVTNPDAIMNLPLAVYFYIFLFFSGGLTRNMFSCYAIAKLKNEGQMAKYVSINFLFISIVMLYFVYHNPIYLTNLVVPIASFCFGFLFQHIRISSARAAIIRTDLEMIENPANLLKKKVIPAIAIYSKANINRSLSRGSTTVPVVLSFWHRYFTGQLSDVKEITKIRCRIKMLQGKYKGVLQIIDDYSRRGRGAHSDTLDSLYALALCYLEKPRSAIKFLENVIEKDSHNGETAKFYHRLNLGYIYQRKGDILKAQGIYLGLLNDKTFKNCPLTLNNAAYVLVENALRDPD